jgi:hypothetical protein
VDRENVLWVGTNSGSDQLRRNGISQLSIPLTSEHQLAVADAGAGCVWTGSRSRHARHSMRLSISALNIPTEFHDPTASATVHGNQLRRWTTYALLQHSAHAASCHPISIRRSYFRHITGAEYGRGVVGWDQSTFKGTSPIGRDGARWYRNRVLFLIEQKTHAEGCGQYGC